MSLYGIKFIIKGSVTIMHSSWINLYDLWLVGVTEPKKQPSHSWIIVIFNKVCINQVIIKKDITRYFGTQITTMAIITFTDISKIKTPLSYRIVQKNQHDRS